MSFYYNKPKPTYIKNAFSTPSRYNKASNKSSIKLTRANLFLKEVIKDSSIITTTSLGKEVYNLKIKDSPITIGYLGYLVNKEKLSNLTSYLFNLGEQFNLKDFFIIINYSLEGKFYYYAINNGRITFKECVDNSKDLSIAF